MPTNFDFLKKVDKNLFEIVAEAEKLYRDEYFEQSMVQTRRFGEHVCKKVLGKNRTTEETFDCSFGNIEEKEFINDLYFLKKHGNSAVHSGSVKKDGMEALECLKRAFEVAISYCIYNRKANPKIMRLSYDTELLVTGEKNKKLSDRYKEAKEKAVKSSDFDEPKLKKSSATKSKSTKTTKKKTTKKQSSVMVCKSKKSFPIFWILVGITFVISLLIFLVLFVSIH